MKKYRVEEIERVRDDLLRGEIVAFGTDTVFGLACVFDNIEAIKKIYAAKNREAKKALPMMCSSACMIEKVAFVDGDAKKIMNKYMPGAITIIFKKKAVVDDYVTSGLNTIGIRVPDDEFILNLINLVGRPLLVTSANMSHEPSLLKWKDVYEKLDGRIDGIVLKDESGYMSSTIVDCSGKEVKILRQGPISSEDIFGLLRG